MAIVATAMQANMVARAGTMTLVDAAPNFALSRVYGVLAKGVVTTLLDPVATLVTVGYTGLNATPPLTGLGVGAGWSGIDQDRFYPAVQLQTLHIGPLSVPFYFGVGGIVEYLKATPVMTDIFAATGNGGTGVLVSVVVNPTTLFDNMESEAVSEDLMVVNATHLGGNPTIPDPTTGAPLSLGDLFVQADALLTAVSTQLPIELLFATNAAIPTTGTVGIVPLSGALTITTLLT